MIKDDKTFNIRSLTNTNFSIGQIFLRVVKSSQFQRAKVRDILQLKILKFEDFLYSREVNLKTLQSLNLKSYYYPGVKTFKTFQLLDS